MSPEVAQAFGDSLARIVSDRVSETHKPRLRLSNLGNSCRRQLWYSINSPELAERLSGATRIKFLIGDITESVILFLARLAGHDVTDEQKTVEVHGVQGHIDAKIDGHLTDVKSASPYSFQKFKGGLNPEQDAFGYLSQLGTYTHAEGDTTGSFLAVDKVLGHLHLDTHEFPETDYEPKVTETRAMLASPTPPPRDYTDEPDGKSGNRKLGVKCSYCDFKHTCFPGLRTYQYSRGPVYLTTVLRPPKVEEK